MTQVNVRYFDPQAVRVIFEENGKYWLADKKGSITESSEYYPNSQHWNGNSPFVRVCYETTKDKLFDNIEIYLVSLVHESNNFLLDYLYSKMSVDFKLLLKLDIENIKELILIIGKYYENL